MARGFLDEREDDGDRGFGGAAGGGMGHVAIAAVIVKGMTAKARRFDVGTKQLFIPYSQLSQATRDTIKSLDAGASVTLHVAEWFATKEGLI